MSTAAQSGVSPYQSAALTFGAALDEVARDGEMLVLAGRAARHRDARVQDRAQERRDAVGVGELEIGAGFDEQLRDGEIAAPRRIEQRRLGARHRRAACRARASRRG